MTKLQACAECGKPTRKAEAWFYSWEVYCSLACWRCGMTR